MLKLLTAPDSKSFNTLARTALAVVIAFICAVFKIPPVTRTILCLVAFLLVSYELVLQVVKGALKLKFLTGELLMLLAVIVCFCADKPVEAVLLGILLRLAALVEHKLTVWAKEAADQAGFSIRSDSKSRFRLFAEQYMHWYIPAIVAAALLLTVIPLFFGGKLVDWLPRTASLLMIACPCSLLLSLPLNYLCTIGSAAQSGVLLSSESCVEKLASVNTVVFDQADALSDGTYTVSALRPAPGLSSDNLLMLAAFVQSRSASPYAEAVLNAYGKSTANAGVTAHEVLPGYGDLIHARGLLIAAGNLAMMLRMELRQAAEFDDTHCLHVAVNGSYAGCIILSKTTVSTAGDAVKKLKELGIHRIVLLSEDEEQIARRAARELDIEEFFSQCRAVDKKMHMEMLLAETFPEEMLAYAGSDPVLLELADIGVSSEDLSEHSAAALPAGNAGSLGDAIAAARQSRKTAWQGILFAIAVKVLVLILAILDIAPLWLAVVADSGVLLLVALNALRSAKKL